MNAYATQSHFVTVIKYKKKSQNKFQIDSFSKIYGVSWNWRYFIWEKKNVFIFTRDHLNDIDRKQ